MRSNAGLTYRIVPSASVMSTLSPIESKAASSRNRSSSRSRFRSVMSINVTTSAPVPVAVELGQGVDQDPPAISGAGRLMPYTKFRSGSRVVST